MAQSTTLAQSLAIAVSETTNVNGSVQVGPTAVLWTDKEGIDRYTVNNGLQEAIAERFKLQSEAQVRKASKRIGAFISNSFQL